MKFGLALALVFCACRQEGSDPPIDEPDAVEAPPDARSIWPDGTPHPANEIWVMSWNIETFPKTPGAVELAAEVLTQVNPDLVAVQEIRDVPSFVRLDEMLPQYERVLPLDEPGADDSIVGLLYRAGVVSLSETETLFSGDWMAFPRLPVKTRATMNGVDFSIVVLHLKAGQGEDDEARRRDAVSKLDTWARGQLSAGVERDVLLIGDLNDEPTDPLGDNIFTPFTDATDTYRLLTLPLAEGGEYTFVPFHSMLDHAIITTDMVTELGSGDADILELELTVDNYTTNLSDHRPLLVKLRP